MGEESDGDANLLEEDSDPQPGPSGESDEPDSDAPTASDPDSDDRDADGSESGEAAEPTASPDGEAVEDGGNPSPADPDAVESGDESDEDATGDADGEATDDANEEAAEGDDADAEAAEGDDEDDADDPDGPDDAADVDDVDDSDDSDDTNDSDDSSGNLQPVETPDVSLDPDQLEPDREPATPDPEGPDLPEEAGRPLQEPPEGAEPPAGPDGEPRAGESAPLAEDVARPDSLDEAAQRTEPLEDEEMPLADHIEEMLKRLAVVLVIAGVVSLAVLPVSETAINFLWNSVLPAGESTRPRLYGPLALVFTKLKVASLAGLVIALPVFVYETYLFMRPGLYPHERRYYLAAVPTSLVLAFVGISFAYFLILPVIFEYFLYYSEDVTTIAFALTKTFNLILLLMGYLAIVFQIPLFIMLAIMMGLTTRRWLVARRLYFWGAFLGIAFLFSPDPTGMAPIMVATTMVVLFEGTLFLLKWTGR